MKTTLPQLVSLRAGDRRQPCSLLVIAACALMAASAFADTALVSDGSPVRILVPTNANLGGTWRNPGFNDSSWTAGTNGVGYEVVPGAFSARVIADSQGDWSAAGLQGQNSWINGYYDLANDPDTTYQASDFQPFPRSEGPWSATNFWDGSAWEWFAGDPPWDTIGITAVHPNGINQPQGEHWVIRRWHSTASGAVTIRFHVRKNNPGGTGVTGKIFKNGVQLFTRAIAGDNTTGFEVYVNTTAAIGDVFDFAHTPVGIGDDPADGADGSAMTATILSGTIVPPPPPPTPMGVADSSADWSGTGVQGANNWFYGYYDRTADADGTYNPNTDFNMTDPNWTFTGGAWQLGVTGDPVANPPWDTIGQSDWHPNGDNQPQGIHWVIRRWVSEVDGELHARVRFAKANTSGNGTTLHVLHNGNEVFTSTLNNTAGIDAFVSFPSVFSGDRLEFALDPRGVDGLFGDGSDSSTFSTVIFTGPPPFTETANSVTEWSAAGVQGANGWYYGFYDETADGDHLYNPNVDFNNTDPNWTFLGGSWQLGTNGTPAANPPWDTIAQTEWHPNGDNQPQGVHWVIKRWVSDVDGDLHANVQFGKQNIGSGNGTTLRVLQNGTQRFSYTVAFNNGTGISTNVGLPGVLIGDKIEFALDPLGTDGTKNDGADGSFIRVSIRTGLPPQPPPPFVPGIADCFKTDIETAMRGVNPSVFIRIPFNVADPSAIQTLKLRMKYNDGFAAYLNGTEIVKRNAPTTIAGSTVADSVADWSTNPDVTVNGWSYGYYNQSLDVGGTYNGGADFTPFPHDGGGPSPTDFWTGTGYDWFNGNPPWTELFRESTHPAAPNGAVFDPNIPATHIHWTVRRWNATVDANLKARIRFRKTNLNGGDGVRVALFHNSVQLYSQAIAGTDGVGRDDTIDVSNVLIGDAIDLLLGPGDLANDGADGSAFSVVLFEGEPTIPWNGAATATRTPTESISPAIFDITSFISELTPGANVLAIQGINGAVSDNEFLINAELLANRVPTATNDTVMAVMNVPNTYPGSLLLANDSDPDGDRLLLVGVTPSYMTAQGGTVRLFGGTVRYTPPAGFTGNDSFNYTITDLSGSPIRASVSVNVGGSLPPTVSITTPTNGATLDACATATICADANAAGDATIARVDFVANGNTPLGFAITTPYCVMVPNAPAGVYALTAIATDSGGAKATSAVVNVTVADRPPVLNNCSNITVECAGGLTPANYTVTALDVCDGPRPVTCTPPSGSGFRLGTSNVTCTATDLGGRTGSCTFTVTVSDTTPPTVNASIIQPVQINNVCGQTVTIQTNNSAGVEVTYIGSCFDACGIGTFNCTPPSGSIFPPGPTTVVCTCLDGAGNPSSCSFTVIIRPDNQPPTGCVAVLGPPECTFTNASGTLLVVSVNGIDACVALQGSATDPDGQPLQYSWWTNGAPFATGATVTNCFKVGCHTVTFRATDPAGESCTTNLSFCVIAPSEAVEQCIELVESSDVDRKNKRPLIASLKAAAASFDRGDFGAGLNQLNAFQNKVRAQIAPNNPDAAQAFTDCAQEIIEAVACSALLADE